MPKKSRETLKKDESVDAALGRIRARMEAQDTESNALWVVFGYGNQNTLTLIAEGKGGLNEAAEHCPADKCRYILLRKAHKVELSWTVKFAYVDWTPDTLNPMRKSLLTVHKGQASDMFAPHHVFLKASSADELDDSVILDKIGFSSGTKHHTTDKKASGLLSSSSRPMADVKLGAAKDQKQVESSGMVSKSVLKSRALRIANEDEFDAAMSAFRSDSDATNWLLVDYKNATTLQFVSSGSGGVAELAANMPADTKTCYYAAFRVTHKIDNSVTVKFGFIKKLNPGMSPVLKAKISTHRGFVVSKFRPFHFDFDLDATDDFSEEIVTARVQEVSMTKSISAVQGKATGSGVPDSYRGNIVKGKQVKTKYKRNDHVNTKSRGLKFEDRKAFEAGVADVRNDATDTTWFLAGYPKKNKLNVAGSGTGGVEEMLSNVVPKQAYFGIVRVTDQIDKSTTVKFVFIKIQPDAMSPMVKASLTLIKGALDEVFAPFHVDFVISETSELDHDILMDKVGRASGTKNLVRTQRA